MTKKNIITLVTGLLIITSILFTMVQNKPKEQVLDESFFYLGTIIDITLFDVENASYMDDIKELISYYDQLFDRHNEKSDVYLLNTNKHHQVSDATYEIIETAVAYSQLTSGYFDITINPLVDLWQIGTTNPRIPSQEEIDHALKKVDYKKITLLEDNYIKLSSDTTIDLGGIAKGYIADALKVKMKALGIEKALINLGGNVYALGTSPTDTPWHIGIRHPEENETQSILKLELSDYSIVTSGVTERFFISDDKRYHHILNPFTGYPIDNNILSVTIISKDSIDGDALATGMFALGVENAFETVNQLEDIQMIMITNDHQIYYSAFLSQNIELFDSTYKLIEK